MAELNLDYYQKDTGYSDGGIETEIVEELKDGKTPEQILEEDNRWAVYYHFSPKRENILNWYKFKKDARILEVGSGCGALTGLLCQKGDEVVSVELTLPRAQVNYERNKEYDNLEIRVGNFNNMEFKEKFDYIILNGVLEYAASFTDTEHPYIDFLKRLKDLLTPDGKILIAIENRLGLKYFNGTPEDHTGLLFEGIRGYKEVDFVRTFSKRELTELLHEAGFDGVKFSYPVPDYKLPETIYTDESLGLSDSYVDERVFTFNRLHLFDESEMMEGLLQEGIADRFQNSFFVEASVNKDKETERTIFAKISDKRKKQYQILTTITEDSEGKRRVYKYPLYPEGQEHVKKMFDYYQDFPEQMGYVNAFMEKDANGAVFEYIEGETFENRLLKDLAKGNKKSFERSIKDFADRMLEGSEISSDYYTDTFREVFGEKELKEPLHVRENVNLDMIFSNIIEGEQETVIDYEWIMNFPVPVEFIIWRSLYYFFYENNLKNDGYSFDELLEAAGINPELSETFIKWDDYFGNSYVGQEDMGRNYYTKIVDARIPLESLLKSQKDESTLYLDFGLGNFEDASIRKKMVFDEKDPHSFTVTYDITPFVRREEGRLVNLRWDPLETACLVENVKIAADNGEELELDTHALKSSDGFRKDEKIFFFSEDPHTDIKGNYDGLGEIIITGQIRPWSETEELIEMGRTLTRKEKKSTKKVKKLENKLQKKDLRIESLERRIKRLEEQLRSGVKENR